MTGNDQRGLANKSREPNTRQTFLDLLYQDENEKIWASLGAREDIREFPKIRTLGVTHN
jgi:hypothetical protein